MITIWKIISGYYYPYRINEEAQVQRKTLSGEWKPISEYMSQKSKNYSSLCVSMRKTEQEFIVKTVKSLMVDSFMGGKKPGMVAIHRNGSTSDCTLRNLEFITEEENGRRSGSRSGKSVEKINENGEVLDLYSSMAEASKANYVNKCFVSRRCKNKIKNPFQSTGFSFRYEKLT